MAKILYHAVPGDWRKEQKYAFLEKAGSVAGVKWQKLTPDKKQNRLDFPPKNNPWQFVKFVSKLFAIRLQA